MPSRRRRARWLAALVVAGMAWAVPAEAQDSPAETWSEAGMRPAAASPHVRAPAHPRDPAGPSAGQTGSAGLADRAFGKAVARLQVWIDRPELRSAGEAAAFGSAIALATLCTCLAAFASGQRRLTTQMQVALRGMEMANGDMHGASAAARDAAAMLSRLTEALLRAEDPLRGWAQAALVGQDQARALARSCADLSAALPVLLPRLVGEALDASQAAAREAMSQAAARLERHGVDIAAAAEAMGHGGQALASAAYGRADDLHVVAALARQCEAAVACVPGAVTASVAEAVAGVQASARAALDAAALRLTGGAGGIEEAASLLLRASRDAAGTMRGQIALQDSAARLSAECDAAAQSLSDGLGAAMERTEQQGIVLSERLLGRMQGGALCLEEAAADMQSSLRASTDIQAAHLASLQRAASRTEGVAALLPEVTAALASGTAALRLEAQAGARTMAESASLLGRAAQAVEQAGVLAEAGAARLGEAALAQDGAAERIEAASADLAAGAAARDDAPEAQIRLGAPIVARLDGAGASRAAAGAPETGRARIDDLLAQTASLLSETAGLTQNGDAGAGDWMSAGRSPGSRPGREAARAA